MEKMEANEVYTVERIEKVTATDDKTIEGDPVPTGKVLRIEFMSVLDITTASKTVRFGYLKENTQHFFKRLAVGASAYGTELDGSLYLVEGEKPICQVESPTIGDEIRFYVRGVYV